MAGLLKVAAEREPGPPSTYTHAHLLLSLLTIGDSVRVGRQKLAREVGLGEGAIRTLLKKFKKEGLVQTSKLGCSLTKRGEEFYKQIRARIPKLILLHSTKLTVGKEQTAVMVRGVAEKVSTGIEQRDAVIKAGASGATTYVIKASKFQIPKDSTDCEKDFPSDSWGRIRDELKPSNGDVVIVCGSSDSLTSTVGALSAALTLL